MNTDIKQFGQKYTSVEREAIKEAAKKQHLKVATFIRKCVLDKINEDKRR